MVTACKLCKLPYASRYRREMKISFHCIPKDPEIRRQWFQIISAETGREVFGNPAYMKVCSQHFEADCFVRKSNGLLVLKPDSIPTLKRVYSDGLVLTSTSSPSYATPMMEMTYDTNPETDETDGVDAELIEQIDDEEELKRLISELTKEIDIQRRARNMYHQRCFRSRERRQKLINQIATIRENEELPDLPENFTSNHAELDEFVHRYFNKIQGKVNFEAAGEDFKEFSLTLFNISSDAYHYIRERFAMCLPPTGTLARFRAQGRVLP